MDFPRIALASSARTIAVLTWSTPHTSLGAILFISSPPIALPFHSHCVCVCVCSTAHKTKLKIRRHTEHHTRFHTDAGDSTQKPNQFGVVSINRILQAHLSIHHPPDPPHTHTPSITATNPFPKVSTITAENYFVFYFAVNTQN